MGIYLNPNNANFQETLNSEIYIDKTGLIQYTNKVLKTRQKYICVSRPRRFGKSMAADMLTAYYSRGCDSRDLFQGLKIAQDASFEKHINAYNVVHINMRDYLTEAETVQELIRFIEEDLLDELEQEFPDLRMPRRKTLIKVFEQAFAQLQVPFVFVIDEWDCIFRVHKSDLEAQTKYLDFLRNLLKDKSYVALAYMTGILPIKKYGEHSALNMFDEYSMTDQMALAEYTGFTEEEVEGLCKKYGMPFEETKRWYDGYEVNGVPVYNPRSVVTAMLNGKFGSYWTKTETYDALKIYIQSNEFGVQDVVLKLLEGETYEIDTTTFSNDMVTFATKDDVLTLLVHLGYLTYDSATRTIRIPNHEVMEQFLSTVKAMGWNEVIQALRVSEELVQATLARDADKVASLIEQAHQENTSILKYNDENSLSCVVSLAYYAARKNYVLHREFPAGKGYADLVFEPRKNCTFPALVVELKWGHSAAEAVAQIRRKEYADALKNYNGTVLLVGINYDEKTKKHSCRIEEYKKHSHAD